MRGGPHTSKPPGWELGHFLSALPRPYRPKPAWETVSVTKIVPKGRYQPRFLHHMWPSTHPRAPPAHSSPTLAPISLINTRTLCSDRAREPQPAGAKPGLFMDQGMLLPGWGQPQKGGELMTLRHFGCKQPLRLALDGQRLSASAVTQLGQASGFPPSHFGCAHVAPNLCQTPSAGA